MDVDKKPLTSITYGSNARANDHQSNSYSPRAVKEMLSRKLNRVSKDLQALTAEATAAIRDGEDSKGYTEKANKATEEKKYLEGQAVLYTKNPEFYSQLYAVQDSIRVGDEGHTASPIRETNKGELYLSIELQMEGSPIGFALRDGKVTFDGNEVSPEQMKEVMDFLYMRGIRDFDLPKGADPKIADTFEQAKEQFNNEQNENDISVPSGVVSTGDENDDVPDEQLSPAERWEKEQAEAIAKGQSNLAGASVQVGDSYTSDDEQQPQQQAPEPEKAKETGFKKAEKELTDWFENGMKKKSEYTYFKRAGSVVLGNGGWTVFSAYENGNEDNIKMDGKRDKKGNVNSTFEYRIYVRPDKSGKGIDVAYAMPKGKKVSEPVADEVLDLYKSQGVTHVNLSKMSYDDAAEFRKACGRKLVVPTGTGLDKRKVGQIIDAAKDRGGEEEILKYKYDLAIQMEKNAAKKYPGKSLAEVNPTDAKYVAELKAEYKYTPFRNQYEGGMRKALENVISGTETDAEGKKFKVEPTADKVIGAGRALAKVYELYEQEPSWEKILDPRESPLSPQALANLNKKLAQLKAGDEKNKTSVLKDNVKNGQMRNFTGFQATLLYEAMMPEEQEQAKKDLDQAFKDNNNLPPNQQETRHDITRRLVQDARDEVNEVSNLLDDNGVKKMFVPNFKQPKYDFGNAGNGNNNGNQNNNSSGR